MVIALMMVNHGYYMQQLLLVIVKCKNFDKCEI